MAAAPRMPEAPRAPAGPPPDTSRGRRVRGPAEARAVRGEEDAWASAAAEEDPLPASAKGADFRTLQEMIAKGIKDAETGQSQLESDLMDSTDQEELRRHREQLRRKQEEEARARQQEKDRAREQRRREDEERRLRMQQELDREEQEELQRREERQAIEKQCSLEHYASVRIQAHVRGRRSRAGKPLVSPALPRKAEPHGLPWAQWRQANWS